MDQREKLNWSGIRAILAPFWWVLVQGVILFLAAGTVWLPRVWAYLIVTGLAAVFSAMLMAMYMPSLANRRSRTQEGTEKWDHTLLICYFLVSMVQVPAVAGWNLGRIGKTALPDWSFIVGLALFATSFLVLHAAMLYNNFFEGTVRIQEERGHTVIADGPYRIVRHPGYVAMILSSLAVPCFLGSPYALVPAGLAVILVLIRTAGEDRVLRERLEGYSDYTERVKYRLVPGLW